MPLGSAAALHHLAETDTLGNLVNGLGQINRNSLYRATPFVQSPRFWVQNCGAGIVHYSIQIVRFAHWDCVPQPLNLNVMHL